MRGLAAVMMLVVLLAAAVVLYLDSRSAATSFQAVHQVAADLRTGRVEGAAFDRRAARRAVAALEALAADPDSVTAAGDDLASIARTAASWAEGARSGSAELHAAVSIRAAAGELRAYSEDGRDSHLQRARSRLDSARRALAGEPLARGPVAGIQDRLDNIEQSQREQVQELNDALK